MMVARTHDNEGRWQEVVSLLTRGLLAGGEARRRASIRISSVWLRQQLTESEAMQIAEALWSETYTDFDSLPRETDTFDWAFILFPQPKPGIAEQRFRQKWLVSKPKSQGDTQDLHDVLFQVGKGIGGLRVNGLTLELSEEEKHYLTEIIKQWLNEPIPIHIDPYFDHQHRSSIVQAIDGLRSILTEIAIPASTAVKLYERIQALNESGLPGFELIPGLVKALPESFLPQLTLLMQTGLASDDEDVAVSAVIGLRHWAMMSAKSSSAIQPPSKKLIHEIGIILANRRRVSLDPALQFAKWVFDKGNKKQQNAIRELALQGLGYLAEELRYERDDHHPDYDVPLLRWRSSQLAQSMSEHGSADAPSVSRWLEIAQDDPLPEVRYAKRADFI